MKIKTVFFDFGGVILKTPNFRWMQRWGKIFGLKDHPDIAEMLSNPNESQLVKDICLGKISEDHVWELMSDRWLVKPRTIQRLRTRFFSKRQLNQGMIKFLAEISQSYQTAILSNAGDRTRQVIEGVYLLDQYVDDIIISAEEGVIKPDPRIFEIAMQRLGAAPKTSLFVDDYMENVLAARDFGMHAVQFNNNQQAIQMMRDYLKEEG